MLIRYSIDISMQEEAPKKVIIIGGGLSGLTAADEILTRQPKTHVLVLQAMQQVGGRTCSRQINGAIFDLGGTWVGRSQAYVQKLAQRAGNELIPQFHTGTKILHIQNRITGYQSNIPLNVGIPELLLLQFNLWKIDRMAQKLDPADPTSHELSRKWDSETVKSWADKNIHLAKAKILLEMAIRAVFGAETDEISFLFVLWYIRQSGSLNNLINIQNGLQERKMSKGAQELSLFLRRQIQTRGGVIRTGCFVKSISQSDVCKVYDQEGNSYESDYLIIAMPPALVHKIQFTPELSRERKLICSRSVMGSITKVLLLYDHPYWRNKGFSGETLSDCLSTPVFNAYDDSRPLSNGQIQPAIIVFINAAVDRQWSHNREHAQRIILQTLAKYFKTQYMLHPSSVHWKTWSEEKSLPGGPIAYYPPGVLTKIRNMREPEGRVHWAGTEMATVSQGFMDGAIQSGIRVAEEVVSRIRDEQEYNVKMRVRAELSKGNQAKTSYRGIINSPSRCLEWL